VLACAGLNIPAKRIAASLSDTDNDTLYYYDLPAKIANLQKSTVTSRNQDGYGRTSFKKRMPPKISTIPLPPSPPPPPKTPPSRSDEELINEVRMKMATTSLSVPELFNSFDTDKSGAVSICIYYVHTIKAISLHLVGA
jgi:hypothetical protein